MKIEHTLMNTARFAVTALLFTLLCKLAHADDAALFDEAHKVSVLLPPKLQLALQDEISKSGVEAAIPVCKEMAPKLAGEISQQTGWKIRRVSLKARNDKRAIPDAWEKAALEDFDQRAARGEAPEKLEKGEKIGNEYRFVKALPVQSLCLACHGSQDQISPAVRSVLDQHYPNDLATGYALGQIRGAISLRKSL